MKKPITLIANWKMYLTPLQEVALATQLVKKARLIPGHIRLVICPSVVNVSALAKMVKGTAISIGSQNVSWEQKGALTGEFSARALAQLGLSHAIIGHSERRTLLHEDDAMIQKKCNTVISQSRIIPIVCVGESKQQRNEGMASQIVTAQLASAFNGPTWEKNRRVVIAYEPIWAIGASQAASPNDFSAMKDSIYEFFYSKYKRAFVDKTISVIYGGSVDFRTIGSFVEQEGCAGVLIGRASTSFTSLQHMIKKLS